MLSIIHNSLFWLHIGDILLVIGGWNGDKFSTKIESIELTETENETENVWSQTRFSELLEPLENSCTAKINSSTILQVGGSVNGLYTGSTRKTHFFNIDKNRYHFMLSFVTRIY